MPPSPITPTPALGDAQLRWRNELDGERAKAAREGGVAKTNTAPGVAGGARSGQIGGALGALNNFRQRGRQPTAQAEEGGGPQITAGDIAKGALQGGVAGIAKQVAGKALQDLSGPDAERVAAELFKENVVIKIGAPALVVFPAMFAAAPLLTIYWFLSLFGVRGTVPSEIHEHIVMVFVVITEIVVFLSVLVLLALSYCMVSPSCQWDVFTTAVIPNVI